MTKKMVTSPSFKPPNDPEKMQQEQQSYRSRKPKWWTKLSGRRGTRSQRKAIQRMTQRGYCLSKEVLTDFSRVNNHHRIAASSRKTSVASEREDDVQNDEWRRAWWNRVLGIKIDSDNSTDDLHHVLLIMQPIVMPPTAQQHRMATEKNTHTKSNKCTTTAIHSLQNATNKYGLKLVLATVIIYWPMQKIIQIFYSLDARYTSLVLAIS